MKKSHFYDSCSNQVYHGVSLLGKHPWVEMVYLDSRVALVERTAEKDTLKELLKF